VLDMVSAFEKASGRKVPYKVVTKRVGDVAEYYADAKKAGELLQWFAKRTLGEMCESTWCFQQGAKSSFSQSPGRTFTCR
jgi:UDP-glucose 4-epimerase